MHGELQLTQEFSITATRAAALALVVGLSGCSIFSSSEPTDDTIDYRKSARKVAPLDVPPDLTPLVRDGRYAVQAGRVSASDLASGAKAQAATSAGATVALNPVGDVRIERAGDQRWLVSTRSPEALWPLVRQFWIDRGFELTTDQAQLGLIETDWAENRAKLPNDMMRNMLGKLMDGLFSTGERDSYRTRVERTATGTEIFISHRGLAEVRSGSASDGDGSTTWTHRPSDPALEAEMLARLMIAVGTPMEQAKAEGPGAKPGLPTRARVLTGEPAATMQVDDGQERAWRRVGLALDRGGFTVEERDRNQGSYNVRYVDPKLAAQGSPNFLFKLFGAKDPAELALGRYRIVVKADGNASRVSVLTLGGEPDNGPNAQRIVTMLVEELKY
jgi:outer membrane protein assembly factor BamC